MVVDTMQLILDKIRHGAGQIEERAVEDLLQLLSAEPNTFVYGAGRSGLVGRAFAMRLMHLGLTVHVVGEATTPSIDQGDVLILISGSGETPSVRVVADEAKRRGARTVGIIGKAVSSVGRASNLIVILPSHIERSGDEGMRPVRAFRVENGC